MPEKVEFCKKSCCTTCASLIMFSAKVDWKKYRNRKIPPNKIKDRNNNLAKKFCSYLLVSRAPKAINSGAAIAASTKERI